MKKTASPYLTLGHSWAMGGGQHMGRCKTSNTSRFCLYCSMLAKGVFKFPVIFIDSFSGSYWSFGENVEQTGV